ncbi:quercetin 2,3-dioxygenase [Pollutimonas nitritireducens]|uniref:Quercetin 2,3-dioxygenase n=1 Tax=Pollutimonas nitritireducens TaxID=2045209 RepID=A0A2N4UEF4_9BURK|nr:pirin family protein [Pollutimonas nitritireducens]PLC53387.1 quercetin 2,3-dioxygenase [Pollutimonas nitritireducens]
MLEIRKASDRGHARHGWLNSHHTFSFAEYYDQQHMGWSHLRVINDDTVQSGEGFGTHGHRDMEIISYVLEGALEHKDSMGSGSVIRPGDVQVMSAGTGVRHSEFNHSRTEPVHFLQIWIVPKFSGLRPNYQEKHYNEAQKRGKLCLVASPDGSNGSLAIAQDARMLAGLLDGSERVDYAVAPGRHAYLHVARGALTLNGLALEAGDGVKIADETQLVLADGNNAEVLLFDLV